MDDVADKCVLFFFRCTCGVSVCACVCLPYLPGGGPWSTMTRAIKVYKREAQLSIKLTGCPRPTLLSCEPHETPENPWPCCDREPGSVWAELGLARVTLKSCGSNLKVGEVSLDQKIADLNPQTGLENFGREWWVSTGVSPLSDRSDLEGLKFSPEPTVLGSSQLCSSVSLWLCTLNCG